MTNTPSAFDRMAPEPMDSHKDHLDEINRLFDVEWNRRANAMKPEEFATKMREIAESGDTEAAHGHADDLLVEVLRSLGYGEGCDVFEAMHKWYA